MPETTEHVYLVNGKPLAASNVVPDSALDDTLGTKADKVSGGTSGDFVSLDSSGNLVDSGISASNAVTDVVFDGGDIHTTLVSDHVATLNEITDDEISRILATLT